MDLSELKIAVDQALAVAAEEGTELESIPVWLQIDDTANPNHGFVQTDKDIDVTYDGGIHASGCVINGWRDTTDEEGG